MGIACRERLKPILQRGFIPTMDETEKKNLRRPSLFDAANLLSEICNEIDSCNDDELSVSLNRKFQEATTSLAESIDRRKFVYREAESKISLARQYKRDLDATIKRLESVKERIEKTTKDIIKSSSVPLKDSLGNRLSIKNNAKALHVVFDMGRKSVSHILSESDITAFEIPQKYIKKLSYLTLDTDLLKADLEEMGAMAIQSIQWAHVSHGESVRGLRT